jgi:hypothetical protein
MFETDGYRSVEFEKVNKTFTLEIIDEKEADKRRLEHNEELKRTRGLETDLFGNRTCTHFDRRPCMCLVAGGCSIQYCNICGAELHYNHEIPKWVR